MFVSVCQCFQPQEITVNKLGFWLNGIGLGLLLVGASKLVSRYPGLGLQRLAARFPGLGKVMQVRSLLYLAELELPLSCGVSMLTALELVRVKRS